MVLRSHRWWACVCVRSSRHESRRVRQAQALLAYEQAWVGEVEDCAGGWWDPQRKGLNSYHRRGRLDRVIKKDRMR